VSAAPPLAGALDKLQTHATAGLDAALFSQGFHRRAMGHAGGQGYEMAKLATENLRAVVGILQDLGAHEDQQAKASLSNPIPFLLLDTPDVRELLSGLQSLLPVAERIDAARGRSLEAPVGGSLGCDLAEDLAQLIARLELELYGPSERVTGGRE
jgi:hypothetical protein